MDSTPGIYHVTGMTDLPFQIVIMKELEDDQYAAYRALTEGADEQDIRKVIAGSRNNTSDTVRGYFRTLLDLVTQKSIEMMRMIEEDKMIGDGDALMEILKDRIDERIKDAVAEAKSETEKAEKRAIKAQEDAIKAIEYNKLQEIRRVMKRFSYTVQESLDFAEIPLSEQPRYRTLLKEAGVEYSAKEHSETETGK